MKIFQKFGYGLIFILAFAVSAIAQTEKEQSAVPNKVAFVNSEMFEDKEKGIKELVDAYAKLSDEFKPQNDELIVMFNKYKELVKQIEELNKAANDLGCGCYLCKEKIEELQDLESQNKSFYASARNLYLKRESQVIKPIKNKIQKAMKQFAKEKGYKAIFDSWVELLVYPKDFGKPDVTDEFIKYYNSLAAKQQ